MSKSSQYATRQPFAGQRASIGRAVLCVLHNRDTLLPGTIVAIAENDDKPVIQAGDGSSFRGTLNFFPTRTVEDLDCMPTSSWTWPPVVPRIDPTQQPLREGTDLAGNPSSRFA